MTLKNQIADDLDDGAVWFDEDELADWHAVNGAEVLCEIGATRNLPQKIARLFGGVVRDSSYLFIRAKEFVRKPRSGETILIDGESYKIADVLEDLGAYVITYGRYDDANLRRERA